jgi:hypothetical protein
MEGKVLKWGLKRYFVFMECFYGVQNRKILLAGNW